jgi:peptide chain release factor 2
MARPDFWEHADSARKLVSELSQLKGVVAPYDEVHRSWQDLAELVELVELAAEDDDAETLAEIASDLTAAERTLGSLLTRTMLSGPDDHRNVIFSIHPGAGGIDSNDWAEMLLRMYGRFFEAKGWKVETIDHQGNPEGGIASAVLRVAGEQVFGQLKSELGVHRLIRISPFDKSQRRHTSFAAVDVLPELQQEEITIRDEDLKIDTYRAGGAGGQHINVTDSAVRITHLPTGIVAQCQNERSQHKNKAVALKILAARIKQVERAKREKQLAELYSDKGEISFGGQIRTYTLHPEQRVKDHRTGVETGDVHAVLDGRIEPFIEAYLKQRMGE